MWQIDQPPQQALPDLHALLDVINQRAAFFDQRSPVTVARAPGRLDLMGGIADYSGALVLQFPLAAATFVAVQSCEERSITIRSTTAIDLNAQAEVSLALDRLLVRQPLAYESAHHILTNDPAQSWAAYVAGVLVVLQHERGLHLDHGLRVLVHSLVPPGKGVASSAALEVASMQAISDLIGMEIGGREMALLCQMVENRIVGAPCGVMDQMTAACGEQDRLLALLCQPAELQASVPLPPDLEVWGIDSGIRHAVSGADYGSVRIGAFMGYRIIAELAGLPVTSSSNGRVMVEDNRWHGYLANISPALWERHYRDHIPVSLDGAAFLAQYGGSTDPVTYINPEHTYAVRQPTAHPIYEHARVQHFRALLLDPNIGAAQSIELGQLMYQSHGSYNACGLGSGGTDRLVALVQEAGPATGLYGAKITGGGSGGTVAVLARRGSRARIEQIAQQYASETGHPSFVFGGSSPGAAHIGSIQLRFT